MDKITLVIPCYNEAETVDIFHEEATKVMSAIDGIEYTMLFVDDGSKDTTLEKIKALADNDNHVKYISFSRNFGKESAMYAGLKSSQGDYTVIMDVDLQDPPSLIPEMYKAIKEEGYDCVGSRRTTRKGEPPIRSFFARCFYKLINRISDAEIVDGARDFQMMNRKTLDAILSMEEYNRFSKGIFGWVGFKKKWLEYENINRVAGETKWSFWKLFLYAIHGIITFSTAPLVIPTVAGIVLMLLGVAAGISFIFIPTYFTAIAALILFVSGIHLICLGIIGQYMSKAYLEVKKRPVYLVRDTNLERNHHE